MREKKLPDDFSLPLPENWANDAVETPDKNNTNNSFFFMVASLMKKKCKTNLFVK
jgi:hypothetical protein